jgi:WD40 repeat protein
MRRFSAHLSGSLPIMAILAICLIATQLSLAEEKPSAQATEQKPVSYHADILPILQANCQGCHQPAKAGGELDLTAFKGLLAAGESGMHAVVAGKPDDSAIIEQITPDNGEAAMPKGKPPLAANQTDLIRRWIEEGANDDTPPDTTPPVDAENPPVYSGPPVITSIDWSPNGELLAVAGFHEVLLLKADDVVRGSLDPAHNSTAGLSSAGDLRSTESAGSGDPRTTRLVARLVGMSERIDSVRFSPDGTKLAVTGGRPARIGEVQVWDVAEKKLLVSVPVTNDEVFGASWSPDGKRVAFGCTDKTVRAIDAETGDQTLFLQVHDDWVLGTTWSNDGSHLVSIGRDMTAKLIEVAHQRFVDNIISITPGALKGGIQSVTTHPLRDEIIFGGADGTPRIYQIHRTTARQIGDDANQLWELPAMPGRVFSIDITKDGSIIAAGSSLDGHGSVQIYRLDPSPRIPRDIRAILTKPVPSRSAAETDKLHKFFADGVQTLTKFEVADGGVYAVALSPQGDRVAAAGSDGTVRIIDSQKGSLVAAFVPVEIKKTDAKFVAASLRDAKSDVADARLRDTEPALPTDEIVTLVVEPASIQLDNPARYAQVVVMAEYKTGAKVDVTGRAKLTFSEPVAVANSLGFVTPAANGNAKLTVSFGEKSAQIDVEVANLGHPHSPDFIRDIAPIIARAGCNAGTCHGGQQGKNGFKLSLRGYDPLYDIRALTDDLASRRVNVASPVQSLMLLKPTAGVPHTGGQIFQTGSTYYESLRQWIAAGAQLNLTSPRVTGIKVTPQNPVIETIGARQQVRVVATYSDGRERDVTREAFVESGNTDVVKTVADAPGLLESLRRGESAALVRYEGNYAATTLTVMGDRTGFEWKEMPANNRIDELVAAKLRRTKTLPSDECGDYEFIRRVYLDLTGLPPTPEQLQSFMDDTRPAKEKRDSLVDHLVGNGDYVDYWTNKWADMLMVNRKFLGVEGATALRSWIRGQLAANRPYDEFVREILTASGSTKDHPAAAYFKTLRTPEALMENTTHLFLATRFNCNKCHDHPFERWTQDQYYHLAAYFAQVERKRDPASGKRTIGGSAVEAGQPLYEMIADSTEGEVKHDRTKEVSPPSFPFECKYVVRGREADAQQSPTRREELAAWITSPDNPYFAKSYVNRLWGYLTGRGIIEPLDDIRAGNPATNPELLEYLTKEFIGSGFNTRHVLQLICKSRTYQLSVATNKWNEDDHINFSHARARRLPAEVLYDAIYRATGATSSFAGVPAGTRAAALPDVGVDLPDGFLGNLGRPARESACECERTSNLQLGPVMALVSGPTVGNAISDPDNAVARLVHNVKDNSEVVTSLFLRFLNRPGKPDEVAAVTKMFDDLEAEHAQLKADFEAYSIKIAPKLAQQEIERQNRVAAIQTELEAYRDLQRLRAPREAQGRAERIATARVALADYDKQLVAKLPEWEAAQKTKTHWQMLEPLEVGATHGAKFTREADGSYFVDGDMAKGSYRIVARIPAAMVSGVRLDAIADDRLPGRGPGRAPNGNFVVSEITMRVISSAPPTRLVRSWDLSADENDWQAEEGVKAIADSGMRHLFGTGQRVGLKAAIEAPADLYQLDIVTGIHSNVPISVEWTTANAPTFDRSRSARRLIPAGSGGGLATPILINAESELTGLRIIVESDQALLPIDAIRLFAADAHSAANARFTRNARATYAQDGYAVKTAVDGKADLPAGNGWAIAPEFGRDQSASFEVAKPLRRGKNQMLEITIHQNFEDGQHALGRFRLSVTDSKPPFTFDLPAAIGSILAKPADKRTDAETQALLAHVRSGDKHYQELQSKLAAEQGMRPDPRIKEIEDRLAAAQQPLPIDARLQQLSRALELSEEQLKNKRLTVAQDVVWALINNPAFLYNH